MIVCLLACVLVFTTTPGYFYIFSFYSMLIFLRDVYSSVDYRHDITHTRNNASIWACSIPISCTLVRFIVLSSLFFVHHGILNINCFVGGLLLVILLRNEFVARSTNYPVVDNNKRILYNRGLDSKQLLLLSVIKKYKQRGDWNRT